MMTRDKVNCVAFEGLRCVASGALGHVVVEVKKVLDRGEQAPVLVFDDVSSEQIEVDFRGSDEEILARLRQEPAPEARSRTTSEHEDHAAPRGPGRPRLGVVAREVTLLPRHWEWLNGQPGGASVTLRKLVEAARRTNEPADRIRRAQEAAYRFMSAIAGNLPGFEEATRALFANDAERLVEQIADWPSDVRRHVEHLVRRCATNGTDASTAATSSRSD